MKNLIIFTDLDGTLLDYTTYSFEKALPALARIKQKSVPLVICSSKTRKEIELYRERLDNRHPFISENGGGIYIPNGYFSFNGISGELKASNENDYHVVRLGERYGRLRKVIETLRDEGFRVRGFGDMTPEELSVVADMNISEARMAKERDFDEPFIFEGDETEIPGLLERIRSQGLNFTQGRFFHIMGGSDKGKAVAILAQLYRSKLGEITTVAIGDSPNDITMLEQVDRPIIVKRPGGTYDAHLDIPGMEKSDGIGPEGWNRAVLSLLAGK